MELTSVTIRSLPFFIILTPLCLTPTAIEEIKKGEYSIVIEEKFIYQSPTLCFGWCSV